MAHLSSSPAKTLSPRREQWPDSSRPSSQKRARRRAYARCTGKGSRSRVGSSSRTSSRPLRTRGATRRWSKPPSCACASSRRKEVTRRTTKGTTSTKQLETPWAGRLCRPFTGGRQTMGQLVILDETGDTALCFDKTKPETVETCRERFRAMRKRGFLAYKTDPKDKSRGEVLQEFDPTAEEIILTPRIVGG